MKSKIIIVILIWLVVAFLEVGVPRESRGELSIYGDKLTVTGMLRYELAVHTAEGNPNLEENHDISLSRAFFQTEWSYKPTDVFKCFAKVRFTSDQTYHLDNHLSKYNAFPVDVASNDWTMMKVSEDDWRAEIWELYTDLSMGNLWLRLGKQQIAWGEMIGLRMMDQINSVDYSWHFMFEPEEFENIRIPNWMIRANYLVENPPLWFSDLTVEGFFNPGDIYPNVYGAKGAPFQIVPNFPANMRITDRDRRGKNEYGVRLGARISAFYFTLNYLYVYNDDASLRFTGFDFGPAGAIINANFEYPATDIYGVSCNYATGGKLDLVITGEAKWVPAQPYVDAREILPAIRDQGTFSYSINFTRSTFILPRPASAAMTSFQLAQVIVEGDEDKVKNPEKTDKVQTIVGGMLMQNLMHNDVTVSLQPMWDTDGAYMVKPAFKYVYGDYWYFDLYAIVVGGSEKRPGRFGSLDWADEVVCRVTFQF